jgi:hypothetical protein
MSSFICKRDFLENIEFDEKLKYLNDYKFFVNLAKNNEFFFIKEHLTLYRAHGNNSVSINKKAWYQCEIIAYEYFIRMYAREIPKRAKAILYFKLARNYFLLKNEKSAKFFFLQALKNGWVIYRLKPILISTKNSVRLLRLFIQLTRGQKKKKTTDFSK